MLRITTNDNPRVLTFRLEGRLEGPWATVFEACWRQRAQCPAQPRLRVDLSGLTFIDAAGKRRLAALREQGAEFIASDVYTRAIVDEIAALPGAGGDGPDAQAAPNPPPPDEPR